MTDPINPITIATPKKGGRVTVDMLHSMAADLNRQRFVRGNGWEYFVNRYEDSVDGAPGKHYLDRRNVTAWPQPTPGFGRRIP